MSDIRNKIIIHIGKPCRNNVQPWVHELRIQVWNSVDNIHEPYHDMNVVDGYLSGELLDRILFCMGLIAGSSYKGRPGFDVKVEMI